MNVIARDITKAFKDATVLDHVTVQIPAGRVTGLWGINGSGKTNLAEAIHYLSLARSWRAPDDATVIKDGERLAYIEADVFEGQLHRLARIEIEKGRKKGQVNQKPVRRLSDLLRVINVLLFSPSDAALFTGPPGERRSFFAGAVPGTDVTHHRW